MESKKHDEAEEEMLYEALPPGNFLRCITLAPGRGDDPLECRLEVINLNVNPTYEAISYVWGSNEKTAEILCNGKRTSITSNLFQALQRTRYRSEPRVLWADSLCISQTNDAEKSHQVALMGQIYAQAKRVLLHIVGDDQGHASTLGSLVREMDLNIRKDLDKMTEIELDSFPRLEPEAKRQTILDTRWKSLDYVLCQPWFSRGWVVQEAALTHDAVIVWGGEEIPWDLFMRCVMWLMARCPEILMRWWVKVYIHSALYALRYKHEAKAYGYDISRGMDLSMIIASACSLRMKDPRDRVFAFLFLEEYAQPSTATTEPKLQYSSRPGQVQPDYTKSTEEIYIEFARRQILHGDIRILHSASQHTASPGNPATLSSEMPSWTPRWDLISDAHVRVDLWMTEPYRPRQAFGERLVRDIRGSRLVVTGVVFDRILYHLDTLKPEVTVSDIALLWQTVSRMRLADAYCAELRPAVMIQCLCGGLVPPEIEWSAWAAAQDALVRYLMEMPERDEGAPAAGETCNGGHFDLITRMIGFWSAGRRLIATARGLLGISPAFVADGDACCIIFGCATPFILRPVVPARALLSEGPPPQYRLVGDAWMGGVGAKHAEGGGVAVPSVGSEQSKDWEQWGLVEQEISIL